MGYTEGQSGHLATHAAIDVSIAQHATDIASVATDLATLETGLPATFAGAARGILTSSWGYLGDSITYGSLATTAGGYAKFVSYLSGQSIRLTQRSGKQGFRSDQLIPFISSEIIPSGATTCFVLLGTNDAAQDVPIATYAANMTQVIATLRAANIAPVIGTVPPRSDKSSLVSQYNMWLRAFAAKKAVPLVELHGVLVNAATGGYLTALDGGDGVHPNLAGHVAIAEAIIAAVAPLIPPAAPILATANVEGANLFANALFLTDANTDGIADGWGTTGTASPVYTLQSDTRWLGKAQKWAIPAPGYRRIEQNISAGFSPGDTLAFAMVLAVENMNPAEADGFKLDLVCTGGAAGTYSLFSGITKNINRAVIYEKFQVPAGTTAIRARFTGQCSTGSVDYMIAQATCVNLTAMGLT